MLRILRSEVFITAMQCLLAASVFEQFFGNHRIDSGVICVVMLFSSCGLLLGITAAGTAPTTKRKK